MMRTVATLCGSALVVWAATSTFAQTATDTAPPLHYRRVYVPANRVKDWPVEPRIPYVAVTPEEFEELTALAETSNSGAPQTGAKLLHAGYQARLEGDDLVAGAATLRIGHQGKQPSILPLAPCSLAIDKPRWEGAPSREATLGAQPSGVLGLRVDQPGVLQFGWTSRGRNNGAGSVSFDLQLPECPTRQLTLDLPTGVLPIPSHGLVTESAPGAQQRRVWKIELGGHAQLQLRIVPEVLANDEHRPPLVRQSCSYDFSPRGLELAMQLSLDVNHEPLRRIALRLDPTLQLVAARYGEHDVPWTLTTSANGGATEVALELPEAVLGAGRVVRLVAIAPLVTDRPWRLPTVVAEGMHWAEGSTQLLLPEPLFLEQLTLTGCGQTKAEPLPAPRLGELVELQHFSPDSSIELQVGRRDGQISHRQLAMIDVGASELSGQWVVDFHATGAEQFSIEAQVANQWVVESIESVPAGAEFEADSGDSRKLSIRLGAALTPSQPLRLIVTGRARRSALEERLSPEDCRMLTFLNSNVTREAMLLRPVRPYQLQTTGDEDLQRLEPTDFDAADAELFTDHWTGLLFRCGSGAERLRFELEPEKPRYAADVRVEATVLGGTLQEAYIIRCMPESARVERLLVHFSLERSIAPVWSMGAETEPQLSARLLTKGEQTAAGLGTRGETWEVVLRRPRSVPFEFRAVRTLPFKSRTALALAALPEAKSQTAMLTLRARNEAQFVVENRRLDAVAADAVADDQFPLARLSLRYDPGRDVMLGGEPALAVLPGPKGAEQPLAWVWNCELDSRYAPDGATAHQAIFQIQNAGRRFAMLKLPAGATLRALWVDNVQIPASRSSPSDLDPPITIELPTAKKFPELVIHYDTASRPLKMMGKIEPALIEIDMPVINTQWALWLPPGFQTLGGDRATSATWSQRLFGPLGRERSAQPLDVASAEQWANLWAAATPEFEGQEIAQEFLQRLGSVLEQSPADLTWGALLLKSMPDEAGAPAASRPLLVDRQALMRLGINRGKLASVPTRTAAVDRGAAVLQQANLVLLVHPRAVILTGAATAAFHRNQLSPLGRGATDGGLVHRVLPGPLREALDHQVSLSSSARMMPARAWATEPSEPTAPWAVSGEAVSGIGGWSAYQIDEPAAIQHGVRVVRRSTMRALGWSLFLIVVALAWWKGRRRQMLLVATMGVAGALALLLPAAYAPVLCGLFLGSVCGLLIAAVRRRTATRRPRPTYSTDFVLSAGATALLMAISVVLTDGTHVYAQDPPAADTEQSPPADANDAPKGAEPLAKVFIPINDNRQPTGERYQVPASLYHELNRRAALVRRDPRGWLITRALYRGSLARQSAEKPVAVEKLEAVFDIQVFTRPARVRIPLRRDEVTLVPDACQLDGQPVAIQWDADSTAITFEVAEPGECQLKLALVPVARNGGPAGFDFGIPTLATAKLELRLPSDSPELTLPSVRGAVKLDRVAGMLNADLGATDRLAVHWLVGDGAAAGSAEMSVDELLWLKVQPGSVVLDARFKIKVAQGRVRQLRLAADPRLRLLPFPEGSPVIASRTEPGPWQHFVLDLNRPVSDSIVVDVKLLVVGTSGVGNLRLPYLNFLGTPVERRLLAVSVDPALEFEEHYGEALRTLPIAEFAQAWGDNKSKPQFAHQLLVRDADWILALRPRQATTTAQQVLSLSCGRTAADIRLHADLNTTAGYVFQHRLRVPAELIVTDLTVRDKDAERGARWTQSPDGMLSVFLASPIAGAHQLVLRGRLPASAEGSLALPRIEIESANVERREIQIWRQAEVLASVEAPESLAALDVAAVPAQDADLGRLVARFAPQGDAPVATIKIAPNTPKLTGTIVTTVERNDGQWQVEADFRLQVKNGVVDALRFEAPVWWSGPYEITPSTEIIATESSGGTRRQLLLRPATTIADEYRLRIRGPVVVAAGDRMRVPQIVPQSIESLQQFVVLPNQSELQQVAWETQGLRAASLPAGWAAPAVAEAVEIFEVVGDSFAASPKTAVQTSQAPQVALADIRIRWELDGTCRGVATFDLEPSGLDNCTLNVPKGYELLQVTVGGLPAILRPTSPTRWHMMLATHQLPQRIEVVFAGTYAEAERGRELSFAAPSLISPVRIGLAQNMHVVRSLWTVSGPATAGIGAPTRPGSITPAEQSLARLKSTARLVDLSTELVTTRSADEVARWYRDWGRRLLSQRDAVLRDAASANLIGAAGGEAAEARTLLSEHEDVARRLGVLTVLTQSTVPAAVATDAADLWEHSLIGDTPPARSQFQGAVTTYVVRYDQRNDADLPWRIAGALALGLGAVGAVVLRDRVRGLDLAWRWPHALGVIVGLCWWLWLWPSAVGWLIVAVSVASSLRSEWRAAPSAAFSTVLGRGGNAHRD